MARSMRIAVLGALLVALAAGSALCQHDRELVLFSGDLTKVNAASWGAGKAELTDEEIYLDRDVLEIQTNGFHEGGRIALKNPEALSSFLTKPENAFLVLTVKVHREQQAAPGGLMPGPGDPMDPGMMDPAMMGPGMDPGMMPPGAAGHPPMPPGAAGHPPMPPGAHGGAGHPPMDPAMMDPAMMDPGMDPGMMDPGMMDPGAMGPGGQAAQAPPPMVTRVRALMLTDKGQIDSGAIDIHNAEDALENWSTIVVPLSAFAGQGMDPAARLDSLALSGDAKEKFWVATVKLVSEAEPLIADAGEQRIVRVGEKVEFKAKPNGPNVRAQYIWDFDDWDGLQEDFLGETAVWEFDEPGYYVVTLTVKDRTGRRLTQTDRVHVKVQ